MYVITAHQRYGQTDRRTSSDVKRHAKACSGKKDTNEHVRLTNTVEGKVAIDT